jgi:hypothetical protein
MIRREGSGQIGNPEAQILIRCNYCNQTFFLQDMTTITTPKTTHMYESKLAGRSEFSSSVAPMRKVSETFGGQPFLGKSCPSCRKPFPCCSVCLLSLSVPLIEETLTTSFRHSLNTRARRTTHPSTSLLPVSNRIPWDLTRSYAVPPSDSLVYSSFADLDSRNPQGNHHHFDSSQVSSIGEGMVAHRPLSVSSPFLVWCQTCRHGGHASHLQLWFISHRMCPVPDCQCTCLDMDKLTPTRSEWAS